MKLPTTIEELRPPTPYGFIVLDATGAQLRVSSRADWKHAKKLLGWHTWKDSVIDLDGRTRVRYMCMSVDDAEDTEKTIGQHSVAALQSYIIRRYLATGEDFTLGGGVRYRPSAKELRAMIIEIMETFIKVGDE